jgi:hypothetical protein
VKRILYRASLAKKGLLYSDCVTVLDMGALNDDPRIREVKSPLTDDMLAPLDSRCIVVQWASRLTDDDFRKLAAFMESYPNVKLRAYGYYSDRLTSLDFLKYFPFTKRFQVDSFYLESLDGLRCLPPSLELLAIGRTKKRLSLAVLKAFPKLRELFLEGHHKDFQVVSELIELERLNLCSITLPDLSPLVPLRKLWSLWVGLGGTKNLRLLRDFKALKYLELWAILGLTDISSIECVPTLEELFLQDLPRVETLPDFKQLTSLRRITFKNMKGIHDLSPLTNAPNLEQVNFLAASRMKVEDFEPLRQMKSLKKLFVGTGSMKRNFQIEVMFPPEITDQYWAKNFKSPFSKRGLG